MYANISHWNFVLIIIAVILIGGCVQQQSEEEQTSEPRTIQQEPMKTLIFEVTIPENTPEGDTVWIYVRQIPYKMIKKSSYTYTITLNETQLFGEGYVPQGGEKIRYRYSRNGYDFHTAEYLVPTPEEPDRDTNNYFWTKHGREISYEPGKIQKDTIERWRWFPGGEMITKTTGLEPSGKFLPRVSNIQFRSGQIIEDFYVPAFHDFFNSTAKHLKDQGFTWVEIDPPWQMIEENNLPIIINDNYNNPNYPDDATLKAEIKDFTDQGLKVMLAPQHCCNIINTQNKSDAWWDAYFSEVEKFLVHFTQLAEESDVDAFHYAISNDYQKPDHDERWRGIFQELRNHFSGDIGEMVWNFQDYTTIPDKNYITWGDELDYFYIAVDAPISLKDSPTDQELKEGAGRMLDGVKELYDAYGKPIIVRTTYFNIEKTWKGNLFYNIGSVQWIGDPEAKLIGSSYTFGPEDQARVVNAYFRAIAERPFIIGYAQFGYSHWENPLVADLSVRGKPSEDIWRKWNELMYSSDS